MDNNDDESPIDRALNLGPIVPPDYSKSISTIVNTAKNDSAKEDFTFARANVREVIENGTDAIAKLATIADQSQNPRAFEVLAKLMDTVTNASKQLLDIQQQIRTIDKADVPQDEEAKKHVTNNLFVGSTSELQKMIENIKNERD
jgi:prophage DNA circulation protein